MLHIYTLSWNGLDKLVKLRDGLMQNLKDIDYHWYIKDNGSVDGTVQEVLKWQGNITCVEYPNNLQNFAEGMNYLYNISQAKDNDYVMLLNNDVIFRDPNSISKMISLFKPNVGVVGARLLFTGTNKLQHAGVVFDSNNRFPKHFRLGQDSDSDSKKDREFQAVTGAVLLTKSLYYKNACSSNKSGIAGMDERFVWAFEDIDLCLNIKFKQNKKIMYCGSTGIYHEESASLKKNPVNKLHMPHNLKLFRSKWDNVYEVDDRKYTTSKNYGVQAG